MKQFKGKKGRALKRKSGLLYPFQKYDPNVFYSLHINEMGLCFFAPSFNLNLEVYC